MSEMTISEYDLEVLRVEQRKAELERADRLAAANRAHDRSINRWRTGGWVAGVGAVVAGICFISTVIHDGVSGPSEEDKSNERIRVTCIENGGNAVMVEDGTANGRLTCIMGPDSK